MNKNVGKKNNWILIDAKDKILGRLSSKIATYLMGKDDITYTENCSNGYNVIIINAKYITITGNKKKNKLYYKHSMYPGGMKIKSLKDLLINDSVFVLRNAVKGMLPKNKLQKKFLKKLKVYPNLYHKQLSQKPKIINV